MATNLDLSIRYTREFLSRIFGENSELAVVSGVNPLTLSAFNRHTNRFFIVQDYGCRRQHGEPARYSKITGKNEHKTDCCERRKTSRRQMWRKIRPDFYGLQYARHGECHFDTSCQFWQVTPNLTADDVTGRSGGDPDHQGKNRCRCTCHNSTDSWRYGRQYTTL